VPLVPDRTIRIAVIVPAWRQARYMAAAVRSALDQEIDRVGVVIVNDGCPDPETHRIGETLRDADPSRVAYRHQPNRGVSAARNAGIELALARWPRVEAIFPLDADNLLSPHTLARLSALLAASPEATWASPALEFFGSEEGEWRVPGPYLPYRQLFMNQCDTGSLIRRDLFDTGVRYDEGVRYGFEDWELFLRASLAGFHGLLAGRCGFRYRRRPESMLADAQRRAEFLEAEIQGLHEGVYERAALLRREHQEAPRYGLVRVDRGDVLLMAACDLEPRRLSLADFARSVAAAGRERSRIPGHVPTLTVFTTAAAIDALTEAGLLADALFRLQTELRGRSAVGLRVGAEARVSTAVRASGLPRLARGALPPPEAVVEVAIDGALQAPPEEALTAAVRLLGASTLGEGMPLGPMSHSIFFEHRHIEGGKTTFPWSGETPPGGTRSLVRVAAA
jgi:glycosyltransferase involved in cell wall biosynthesis